jgi:hypothetical protein
MSRLYWVALVSESRSVGDAADDKSCKLLQVHSGDLPQRRFCANNGNRLVPLLFWREIEKNGSLNSGNTILSRLGILGQLGCDVEPEIAFFAMVYHKSRKIDISDCKTVCGRPINSQSKRRHGKRFCHLDQKLNRVSV